MNKISAVLGFLVFGFSAQIASAQNCPIVFEFAEELGAGLNAFCNFDYIEPNPTPPENCNAACLTACHQVHEQEVDACYAEACSRLNALADEYVEALRVRYEELEQCHDDCFGWDLWCKFLCNDSFCEDMTNMINGPGGFQEKFDEIVDALDTCLQNADLEFEFCKDDCCD